MERSELAYVILGEQQSQFQFQEHLNRDYLTPTEEEIRSAYRDTREKLQSGVMRVVIPMKEQGPKVSSVLNYLTTLMPREHIIVVNDRSDDEAVQCALSYGVVVVHAQDVLNAVDLECLRDVLCMDQRPHGKGVAVFAGYLVQYVLAKQNSNGRPLWICQHDSEIGQCDRYRSLEYLMYGAQQSTAAQYVKMAKTGRNNERPMTARSMLRAISTSPAYPRTLRERAYDIYKDLTPDKWMLTGEFMLRTDAAWNRPFATGYLEETLIALHMRQSVRVANPNPRMDAVNTYWKESVILQHVSNFLVFMAGERPPSEWTLEDIRRINHSIMAQPLEGVVIPDHEGPCEWFRVENDRIMPSIEMLWKENLVDESKLLESLSKRCE